MEDVDSFMETIAGKKIIIYGAGYVATQFFYRALKDNGLASEIECFCVSKKEDDISQIYQIPVIELDGLCVDDHAIVCIAVHETLKDEIVQALEAHQIRNYIWVYPYIHEMLYGIPIHRNVKRNVQEILRENRNNYRIPIRYAAIENLYGKNTWGIDLYLKEQNAISGEQTANKRWERFKQLIIDWESFGYDPTKCVYIENGGLLLDGTHRVTLAKYFGQKYIMCDVMKEMTHDTILIKNKDVLLEKEMLGSYGFTEQEISAMDEIWERILKRSECSSQIREADQSIECGK